MTIHSWQCLLLYLGLGICEIPVFFGGFPVNPFIFGAGLTLLFLALVLLGRSGDPAILSQALSPFSRPTFFWSCIFYSVIAWFLLMAVYYLSDSYHIWDTGSFAHELAQYVKGRGFYSAIMEKHALADHFCPNLFLLAPLFKIKITYLWLIVFKLLAFLACPFLLLRIGRQILGNESPVVYVAPILFLLNSLMIRNIEAEFQPSALSLPFVLLAFLFALKRRYSAMYLTLIFLVGFKEHLPLVWVCVGLFMIGYLKEYRRGIVLMCLGMVLGLSIFFIVMPAFNLSQPTVQAAKWGPFALIDQKLILIGGAFLFVGFIPLFAPRSLPMIIAAFSISLVSNVPSMVTYFFHYQDMPLTVLSVGVIWGLKDIQEGKSWVCRLSSRWQAYAMAVVIFVLVAANALSPAQYIRRHWPTEQDFLRHREVETLRTQIGNDCDLWVTERVGVHFIDHPRLKAMSSWAKNWLAPLDDRRCHWIILRKDAVSSSLTPPEYEALKSGLDQGLKEGRYHKLEEFRELDVYRSVIKRVQRDRPSGPS